jgi:hypothetical protein
MPVMTVLINIEKLLKVSGGSWRLGRISKVWRLGTLTMLFNVLLLNPLLGDPLWAMFGLML